MENDDSLNELRRFSMQNTESTIVSSLMRMLVTGTAFAVLLTFYLRKEGRRFVINIRCSRYSKLDKSFNTMTEG